MTMFIDMHGHAYRKPCPFPNRFATMDEMLAIYDRDGIRRAVLQPLVGPETYLPQSNDDILEMVELHPDRFIPFCNVDPRALTNSCDAPFGDLLRYYRDRGVKGVGEFMPNLPFLDPLVQNFFKHVQDVGFPLCFDSRTMIGGGYGLYDEAGMPQLEKSLLRFPKLVFIGHGPPFWAEMGRLDTPGDRAGYPAYPIREEGVMPKLMRRHPNLWADLSAGSGFNALNRDLDHAVTFLNEFQDRLMFGTDICSPDAPTPPLIGLLNTFKAEGKISAQTYAKIACGNAIRLLKIDNGNGKR